VTLPGGRVPDRAAWVAQARALGVDRVLVVRTDGTHDQQRAAGGPAPVDGVLWVDIGVDPIDQHDHPFAFVGVDTDGRAPHVQLRAALHQATQHLLPAGVLGVPRPAAERIVALLGEVHMLDQFEAVGPPSDAFVLLRRTGRTTVHDLMWEARRTIRRIGAAALADELAGGAPPLVIDTRTHTDRGRAGIIAGSLHVPRTVLEWHLDPANGYRHPRVEGFHQPLVLVCNGGYSSSLAAANLVRLGFADVRDLVGGMRAWIACGLPVVTADHDHLDL
jgi:rhodanese-related sulfurtransferase